MRKSRFSEEKMVAILREADRTPVAEMGVLSAQYPRFGCRRDLLRLAFAADGVRRADAARFPKMSGARVAAVTVPGQPECSAGCRVAGVEKTFLRNFRMERADLLEGGGGSDAASLLAGLIAGRHSCRRFLPDAVARETILRIVKMAQFTASWCNAQPWRLIVTEGEGTDRFRDALYAHACRASAEGGRHDWPPPPHWDGVYRARRRESGWALYRSLGIERGDRQASGRQRLENFRLFGAPHVAIVTTPADLGVYGTVDAGGFVAMFMLSAHSLGVASIAQAAIASQAQFVREYFAIPAEQSILCGISFGYADQGHAANAFRTSRADPQDVVTWA